MSQYKVHETKEFIWKHTKLVGKDVCLVSFSGSPLALFVKRVGEFGSPMIDLIVFSRDLEKRSDMSLAEFVAAKGDILEPFLSEESREYIHSITEYEFLQRTKRTTPFLDAVSILALDFLYVGEVMR